jgi:S1-C subfamily serine protease
MRLSARRAAGALGCVALLSAPAAALSFGVGVTAAPLKLALPAISPLSAPVQALLRSEPQKLSSDRARRHLQMMTLRVRNISCDGESIGSAFAVDRHTLITNRHVLAGAAVLELNEWDGTSIEADLSGASTGRLVDIGVSSVARNLPAVAKQGPAPRPGDPVSAVGYPLGGQLTVSKGTVLRYRDGRTLDPSIAFDGQVIEISAKVKHGNSGGPLLDAQGRVVGVIFAGKPGVSETDYMQVAYAIPLSAVHKLLAQGGNQAVIPCEQ